MPDWLHYAGLASDAVGTPCFVMSELGVREGLDRLSALGSSVPLRHWMSLKTQPVARLVQLGIELGLGMDVVSEYELAGALSAGVSPERVLVNGVAKHRWLRKHGVRGLSVHLDSVAEVRELAGLARSMNWRVGLRCAIPDISHQPGGEPAAGWDQFGMTAQEIRFATTVLADAGVAVRGLHFHLHTNVAHAGEYQRALEVVAEAASAAGIAPDYVDVGGGIPISGEQPVDGDAAADTFDTAEFRDVLASVPSSLPSVREIWLENGRFLTGPAGVLVITVLDRKVRGDRIFLICDGGRVNHARMAAIERHEILLAPHRTGALRETVICGPTCSAVDRLGSWLLPDSIEPGDRVIWMTAGAYHMPLETRFSTGLAPVVWFNARHEAQVIRERETSSQWWGQWSQPRETAGRQARLRRFAELR